MLSLGVVLSTFVVALVTIFITHWVHKWRNPKCENGVLPPGSMGLPLIGETIQLLIPSRSLELHPFISKRVQRYGPVFRTNIAGKPVVVTTDPKFNHYILTEEGKSIELWYLDTFTSMMPIYAVGNVQKYIRNTTLSRFGVEGIRVNLLSQIEQVIQTTLRHWSTNQIVDVKHDAASMIFDFTLKQLISYDWEKSSEKPLSKRFSSLLHGLLCLPLDIPGSMEPEASKLSSSSSSPSQNPKNPIRSTIKDRDFLNHLESYLAKRDGVDKLLKISRYATKIILASSLLPETLPLNRRLKSFESSVGVSRKAFRLGKFVQDVNALRNLCFDSREQLILSVIAYGSEGLYYFVEQFVWLAKSGLIDAKHLRNLQKISAWAEFIGYLGSVSLKIRDLKKIAEEEDCLRSSIEIAIVRGDECGDQEAKIRKLREKKFMKKLSIVQDLADGLMAVADIQDGKGPFSGPLLISSAGLLSAMISTHKNWLSS